MAKSFRQELEPHFACRSAEPSRKPHVYHVPQHWHSNWRDCNVAADPAARETILIDSMVHVTVVEVKGYRVQLGVAAPPAAIVDRQVVHKRRLLAPDPQIGLSNCLS